MSKLWEKLLGTLVVSIFSFAALIFIGLLTNLFYLHLSAQHWVATSAEIMHWDAVQTKSQYKNAREKIVLKYRYQYEHQAYTGNKLDFSLGSDSFSGRRRQQQMEALRSEPISIWVNPYFPAQSVFDRSLPVSQVTFMIFFLIFPCGLGTLFLWVYLLKGFSHITGIQTERYAMPLWGLLHGMPALYPLLFSFSTLSSGSFLLLSLFSILALYGLIEVIYRMLDPKRGTFQIKQSINPVR